MKKLKKIFVLMLIAAFVSFGLTGCNNKSKPPSETPPTSEHPSKEAPSEDQPTSEHPAGEHPK